MTMTLFAKIERFSRELESSGAYVKIFGGEEGVVKYLFELCERKEVSRVIKTSFRLAEEIDLTKQLGRGRIDVIEGGVRTRAIQLANAFHDRNLHDWNRRYLRQAQSDLERIYPEIKIGISGAIAGIASLGTIMIAKEEGNWGLVASLPPVHVVIMETAQVKANLDEVFAEVENILNDYGELLFVTGPSETADIGLVTVKGVHGPTELHVLIMDRSYG